MITGWPKMQGPQNAMVVGPAGEEIYTDNYGRVKIQFPWDRYGQYNENSSCWVRMSNNWAGKNWGGIFIPRIGQEVIVDFYDGNPDRPIITGRVYNAEQMPPNTLPAQKTRMTLRSDTHKGEGFNELTFEDEAGQEQIYLHAQKDHNTVILNDETHQIGRDRAKSVGQNQSERIGNDKKINVGNDHTETIGNDGRYSIGRDVHYDIGRTQHEHYGKDHIEGVGNILKQNIYADHLYQAGRNYDGQVNGTYKLDVGTSIDTNTGVHHLKAYKKFIISGPSGKIVIDGSGITLEAPNIRLKGAVSMGGSGGAQVPTLNLASNEIQAICEECERKKKG
jgi:type VI secretion system secreted protein VgrG